LTAVCERGRPGPSTGCSSGHETGFKFNQSVLDPGGIADEFSEEDLQHRVVLAGELVRLAEVAGEQVGTLDGLGVCFKRLCSRVHKVWSR